MVRVQVTVAPEITVGDRTAVEWDLSDYEDAINSIATHFVIPCSGSIPDYYCFHLPQAKKALSPHEAATLPPGSTVHFGYRPKGLAEHYLRLLQLDAAQQKKAIFMVKKEFADEEFARAFLQQDGISAIAAVMMELTGSALAYCLSALETAMNFNIGWEALKPEHIEMVSSFEFISSQFIAISHIFIY
jgi:hypothetical protein